MENQLDPQVVNLAKAIRQTESGGDYTVKGASGEHGGYQFTEPTWDAVAPKYGIKSKLKDATPEQQNAVAYNRIKEWKDQGRDVTQIASMWNAGEAEPNAYTGKFGTTTKTHKAGDPSIGVNSYGAKYDVPTYVKSVASAYLKLKNGQQVSADPNNPSSVANPQNQALTPAQQADKQSAEQYGALFPSQTGEGVAQELPKAIGNLPSSAFNMAKSLGNAALHPVKTIEDMASLLFGVGEKIGAGISGKTNYKSAGTDKVDALVQHLKDRYGSLENFQRTATNDPFGVGTDVFTILEGGTALADKALGTETQGLLNQGLEKTADVALAVPRKVGGVIKNLGAEALGKFTGVGAENIQQGLQASREGGAAAKAFAEGQRGISQEDIVNEARSGLDQLENTRANNYRGMLSSLEGDSTTYDISPVMKEFDSQLEKFGISKAKDGSLDFSRSTLSDTADINKIQGIYDDLRGWGLKPGDRTALGIDTLKRRIGNYYSPTSDFRAMTTALKQATKGVLEDAPGYTKAMKDYAEMSDQISDIRKGLSLGDNAMVETTFKKLTSALRQNNEFRAQFVKELDSATGGQLLSKIAGQQMSVLLPRGLLGPLLEAGGVGGAITSGTGLLPLLGTLAVTSPKLVGLFLRAMGLTARGVDIAMRAITPSALNAGLLGSTAQNITAPRQGTSVRGLLKP